MGHGDQPCQRTSETEPLALAPAIIFAAQAQNAAKKSVELSGAKQIATAQLLYAGDSDDTFAKGATVNGGWANGECNGTVGCTSWDKLAFPYMKSWALLDSPLDRSVGVPFPGGTLKRSFRAALNVFRGMNGKWWDANDMSKPSINGSQAGSHADTIMLTNQRNEGLYGGSWWIWSTWYENWVWWCFSANTRPNNPALVTPFVGDATPAVLGGPNNYWGGVDVSAGNTSTYAFLDGHVKAIPPGYQFPGYLRKADGNQPIDNRFQGVCLWVDQWSTDTSKDCPVPQ